MAKKKKARRKKTPKKQDKVKNEYARFKRAYFFFDKGVKHWDDGKLHKALACFMKALKAKPPESHNMFEALVELGREMERKDVVLQGYAGLFRTGHLSVEEHPAFITSLIKEKKYNEAIKIIKEYRRELSWIDLPKKEMVKQLHQASGVEQYCKDQIKREKQTGKSKTTKQVVKKQTPFRQQKKRASGHSLNRSAIESEQLIATQVRPEKQKPGSSVSDHKKTEDKKNPAAIPVTIKLDNESFFSALGKSETVRPETLYVTIDAHRISFRNSFENLICPPFLHDIESFWYQEETVRKVLKTFRGRAMLADEVGLGKTIEAGMVLKEYIERGMVKSVLILTPTPLVSQWQEELQTKFDLDFVSTDDQGVKINDEFWQTPFVLASINQAKSKKNFSKVTSQEYDMVIVDEAHHLKNRNTLNWKLVNALKKRFLLFLTATPVENNLMELYNLITLLKPGLLKTASEFKKEFMTQGDAVSPRNRTRLRSLLDQVMIRNTRALAALNIPPRFAQTVKINPVGEELKLYEMVTNLACSINKSGRRNRMLLKNLLAEAGSSPRALSLTLRRLLERDDDWLNDFRDRIEVIRNLCRSITGETGKNKALGKLLKNTRGKKIVFVKYIGSMDEISDYLSWHDISFVTFNGSMSNRKKDEAIESFRDEKDILITTEIGGEGRNLQFCHQMINYDLPWNPMKIEQRIGRIHRLGQQNEVMIYNFCGKGSMEEYTLEILDKKINMFEMVIGEIDMILGRVRGEKDFEDMVYEIWVNSDSPEMRGKEFAKLGTRIKRSKTRYGNTRELDEKLFGDDYEL